MLRVGKAFARVAWVTMFAWLRGFILSSRRQARLAISSFVFFVMSQRFRGMPKGMPLPTTPLQEMIRKEVEERRRRGGDLSHLEGTPYAALAAPKSAIALSNHPRSAELGATSKATARGAPANMKGMMRTRTIPHKTTPSNKPHGIVAHRTHEMAAASSSKTRTLSKAITKHRPQRP